MITLQEFIDLSMDSYYKINIFSNEDGEELLRQCEIENIEKELEKIGKAELLFHNIGSWDIDDMNNNQFTLNID
jgi:hypothetical protein